MEWFSTPMLQMAIAYGGHVAEDLFFGESIFKSGKSDKKFVDEIAFNMVTKWGMSPNLKFKYLNFKTTSEEDKKLANNEIDSIKKKFKEFATEIINEHRNEVIKIAAVLMKHYILSGQEIKDIVQGKSAFFS